MIFHRYAVRDELYTFTDDNFKTGPLIAPTSRTTLSHAMHNICVFIIHWDYDSLDLLYRFVGFAPLILCNVLTVLPCYPKFGTGWLSLGTKSSCPDFGSVDIANMLIC